MKIKELLKQSKDIWHNEKLSLSQIIPRMGKIFGDICRYERNANKDILYHTDYELKKEIGNMIFSSIRWANDLGYDPEECINMAIICQKNFKKSNNKEGK